MRQFLLWVAQYEADKTYRTDPTGERASLDRLTITSKGFQFLLEDRQTQLWQILMYYLASKEVGIPDSSPASKTDIQL